MMRSKTLPPPQGKEHPQKPNNNLNPYKKEQKWKVY